MEEKEFINNCESCGAQCCRNWNPAQYDKTIVDEKGICKYLNTDTNLCTIYENRPDFCQIYKWYEIQFSPERLHGYGSSWDRVQTGHRHRGSAGWGLLPFLQLPRGCRHSD